MKKYTFIIVATSLSLFSCASQKIASYASQRTTASNVNADPIQDGYLIDFNLTNDQKRQFFNALAMSKLTIQHQFSSSTELKNMDLCTGKSRDCKYKTVQQILPLIHKNVTQDITCFMNQTPMSGQTMQTRCLFYLKTTNDRDAVSFYLNITVRWSQGGNSFFAPVEILEVGDYAQYSGAS